MKKFKFPAFKFNFKWPHFKNLHFKNRFSKTFPLNTSVISGWPEIILYFVFVIVGVVLFYSWNQVREQEYWFETYQIRKGRAKNMEVSYDIELNFPAKFHSTDSLNVFEIGCSFSSLRSYVNNLRDGDTIPRRLYRNSSDAPMYFPWQNMLDTCCAHTLVQAAYLDSNFVNLACNAGVCAYSYVKVWMPKAPFHNMNISFNNFDVNENNQREKRFGYYDGEYIHSAEMSAYHEWDFFSKRRIEAIKSPKVFSLYDISCSNYKIKIRSHYCTTGSLKIKFDGCADFSKMYPEPDEVGFNYIIFNDQTKLEIIEKNGLEFFATFPELQNKQYVRTFALTAILSIFATTLLAFLLNAIFASFSFTRKKQEDVQTENSTATSQE